MDTFGLDEDEFQEPDDSITWVFQFTGTMVCKILHERLICYSWVQCKWLLLNILLPVCELCCSGPFDRIGDISFRMNAHEDNVSWVVLWCCYLQDRNNKLVQLRSSFRFLKQDCMFTCIFYLVHWIPWSWFINSLISLFCTAQHCLIWGLL